MILATLPGVETADFLFVECQTGLTHGNLSLHMSKLEDAGYIEIAKAFVYKIPRTLLRIRRAGRSALLAYTRDMKQVLESLEG